jgi:hypothetical protein
MTRSLFIVGCLWTVALTGCFSTVKSSVNLDQTKIQMLKAFDYGEWNSLLVEHVNGDGQVDYQALIAKRARLDTFVALIGVVGPSTRPKLFDTPDKKLAYYINAYNALTMFNVINRLPGLRSVNDEEKDFFYFTEFTVDGKALSLYKLENEVIRPMFKEPRIHFALNCASAGCPVLPAEAFLPEKLEAQLERETQKFVHEKRNVIVDEQGMLVLSQIFNWYAVDFAPTPLVWIRQKAPDLSLPESGTITHRPYDWALNVQKK